MEHSLSVLLPVRNAQSTLAATVTELLDVLPELTKHFDLLIIDDGSTDYTIEVADELATRYPQIRVVRHGHTKGRDASIETGLRRSLGDVIFLQDDDCRLPVDGVGRLWRAMDRHDLVLGCPRSIAGPQWNRWKNRGTSGQPGCLMVRRKAIEPIQEALTNQTTLRDRLDSLGYRWHEVEMRDRLPHHVSVRPAATMEQVSREAPATSSTAVGVLSRPKAPNYLSKQKDPSWDG